MNLLVYLSRLSRDLKLNLLLTIRHLYRYWLTIDINTRSLLSRLHLLSRLPVDQHLRSTWLPRPYLLTMGIHLNMWQTWLADLHTLTIDHNLLPRLNWLTIHQDLLLNTWLSRHLSIDPYLWHLRVSWRVDLLHRLVVDPYLRLMLMRHIVYHLTYFERFLQVCCEADTLLHRHLRPIDLMKSLCLLYNFE